MARPKSEDKRNAILEAATRVIVEQGLSATTARIAQEAGISTGSLFTYFETKTELLNTLYLELKTGMAAGAFQGVPESASLREELSKVWSNWMNWAVAEPHKRQALAQLNVSEELTPETRAAGHKAMARIASLLERCRANGLLQSAPMSFVVGLMDSMAQATIDIMTRDSSHARKHCNLGFEALWRVIG